MGKVAGISFSLAMAGPGLPYQAGINMIQKCTVFFFNWYTTKLFTYTILEYPLALRQLTKLLAWDPVPVNPVLLGSCTS